MWCSGGDISARHGRMRLLWLFFLDPTILKTWPSRSHDYEMGAFTIRMEY